MCDHVNNSFIMVADPHVYASYFVNYLQYWVRYSEHYFSIMAALICIKLC